MTLEKMVNYKIAIFFCIKFKYIVKIARNMVKISKIGIG